MSDLHRMVRERCGQAVVSSCTKRGCTLKLDGIDISQRTVVDIDLHLPRLPEGQKKADYYVFVTQCKPVCVVVEMKDGQVKAADSAQLQAGATHLESHFNDLRPLTVLPLLVHRSMSSIERKSLARRRVRFRGMDASIITCRCGDLLVEKLA
jgi:hypothetical protein